MQAHLNDTGAHQPHDHPHTHCPPGTYEASATPRPGHEDPADPSDAEQLAAAEAPPSHCDILELLDATLEFFAPTAHAQAQPPPLQVYRDDLGGPSETAPATPRTNLEAEFSVDVPLIDTVRALIAQLDAAIRQHVASRPGHAHGHPHSSGGGGTELPRVSRRLQTLRDWSDETFKQILPGASGTGSAVGPGSPKASTNRNGRPSARCRRRSAARPRRCANGEEMRAFPLYARQSAMKAFDPG